MIHKFPALFFRALTISLLATLLLSCSSNNQQPDIEEPTTTFSTNQLRIQQLLIQSNQYAGGNQPTVELQLARLFLEEKQRDLAEQRLESLEPSQLSGQNFIDFSELMSEILLLQGNSEAALNTLDNTKLSALNTQLSLDQQLRLSALRAKALGLLGQHLASAQQRVFIDPLLSTAQQQQNRKNIWRSLMYVPTNELEKINATAFGEDYQGWLALALIAKSAKGDLNDQVTQLDNWQQHWSQHPANQPLPDDLQLIRELAASQAQQLALLLPLSGPLAPYGKAIRDGFLSSYFDSKQQYKPIIKIYDSAASANFINTYQQSISDGAEVIIGPLDKQQLRLLFDEEISIPTLALNRITDYGTTPELLYQFSLSPEDEARQVAIQALLETHQRALLITPDGGWAEKVSQAFSEQWQAQEGEVVGQALFTGQRDFSAVIKGALHLQNSEQRAKRIQTLIGQRIEFEPRRRQDIDMIFLLAKPDEARSIKPLLNFHYAANIPVYGTSRLYTGYKDQKKDRDLNAISFTDIPWVLNEDNPLKSQINQEWPSSRFYQRMYALGVDSFHLYPRLRQLQAIPDSHVYGETGTLHLNQKNQLERRMSFAQFTHGIAKPIANADESLGN